MTASVQPNFTDMDDDDDMPLRFKRPNMASKSNVSNSEANTSSSQKHDGQVGRQISNANSLNGQNSTVQKDKTVPSSKASPVKSPLVSPRASPPPSKTLPANTAVKNSKPLASPANRPTNLNQCRSNTVVKEEKPSVSLPNDDSDSEDNKPLSNRVPGLPKSNSNHCNKVPGASTSGPKVVCPKDEDSDDEMPLLTTIKMKSNPGASTMKSSAFNKDKPVLPKREQNGSASSTVPSKRSPVETKSSAQSSVKKPRLSDSSASAKSKQPLVKPEKNEDDDEDNIPISQRIKKSSTPVNKSSSTRKATAVVSSSHKITKKKMKKVKKNSKYSQSSKVPPSSGEAQKWTTLVHNGVIFPPPYKPHGVKMLYKGQPVDLTPEQEEVASLSLPLNLLGTHVCTIKWILFFFFAGCNNVCSDARYRVHEQT